MSESESTPEKRTIEEAIDACEKNIFWQRVHSLIMGIVLAVCLFTFYRAFKSEEVTLETFASWANSRADAKLDASTMANVASEKSHAYLAIMGLFLVVFGIIVAVYRFHLVEIARNEQIKLGLWRIRIAARNTTPGFQTEVRQSLTQNAFSYERKAEKGKNIESPVPGHPGSDLVTAVLNKILDNVEIVTKKPEK